MRSERWDRKLKENLIPTSLRSTVTELFATKAKPCICSAQLTSLNLNTVTQAIVLASSCRPAVSLTRAGLDRGEEVGAKTWGQGRGSMGSGRADEIFERRERGLIRRKIWERHIKQSSIGKNGIAGCYVDQFRWQLYCSWSPSKHSFCTVTYVTCLRPVTRESNSLSDLLAGKKLLYRMGNYCIIPTKL